MFIVFMIGIRASLLEEILDRFKSHILHRIIERCLPIQVHVVAVGIHLLGKESHQILVALSGCIEERCLAIEVHMFGGAALGMQVVGYFRLTFSCGIEERCLIQVIWGRRVEV